MTGPGGSCVQGSKYAADRTVCSEIDKRSENRPVPAPRTIIYSLSHAEAGLYVKEV